MLQTFDTTTSPAQGPARLSALREWMAGQALDGYLVPRADRHQGEYVAACDERLAWLTGFTGSAGFACVLCDIAGVFIDGRYRIQVQSQVADVFTPVPWPEVNLADWLQRHAISTATIGFDPWLHTVAEIEKYRAALQGTGITLAPCPNGIDAIWTDRPAPPQGHVTAQPLEYAGEGSTDKCNRLADDLRLTGTKAAVLTLPDSICWLLNIRGTDIPRNPIVQAFAILGDDGRVKLFADQTKFAPLGPDPKIDQHDWFEFEAALQGQPGPIQIDPASCPYAVADILGSKAVHGMDPCVMPKACKNQAEIAGTRAAHLRDGAAMCEFLAWLDGADHAALTEIDVVKRLETCRRDTGVLQDISFETICGSGPNGAIVHYRVTHDSNRPLDMNSLLLIDSGGQYRDGTTDITRTVAIGTPSNDMIQAFTRVLQGMIAISTARFPVGLTGRDLDALARAPLWRAGQDYDHGTGHGVGSYLSVHEGPQRISRASDVALAPGMILSNEPGYYRAGQFGIRIENLIVVEPAPVLPGADARDMLSFETLTLAPIDRRLIDMGQLAPFERDWINTYHAQVWDKLQALVSAGTKTWLKDATAPL
ncbi:MAG: aminopeptidase P family protein [Planktomarina sp.]